MTAILHDLLDGVSGGHHDHDHGRPQQPANPLDSELWQCVRQADEAVASGRVKPGYFPSCLHLLPKLEPRNQR
jgi:hypothetical protein